LRQGSDREQFVNQGAQAWRGLVLTLSVPGQRIERNHHVLHVISTQELLDRSPKLTHSDTACPVVQPFSSEKSVQFHFF
jgi:hypothetical protein